MKRNLYIGIDGGATKTKVRIEDADGCLLTEAQSGPGTIRTNVSKAWYAIIDGIQTALHKIDLDLYDQTHHYHVGLGLAGTEVAESCEEFLSQAHPFASIALKSDAYTACLGAHQGKEGGIIIIGTGTIGLKIEKGVVTTVGGWGFPHDDEGSGAWLGMEAIRLTLESIDHRREPSDFSKAIFRHFKKDLDHMVTWSNQALPTHFAELAPIVVEYVKRKNPDAIHLVERAGVAIGRTYDALVKQSTLPKLPVSLLGGLSHSIEPWLPKRIRTRCKPPQGDATQGAILMIKKSEGFVV